ncbi:MAG: hypothetical protein NC201_03915 [Prevotella sp.]|nr:hypothetical protein [Bacteroides sp.]MCM1366374.1 hypothetical protein [Prevotella sp.]MCM1436697.1 hypothetical protein [Prevotella sp.]
MENDIRKPIKRVEVFLSRINGQYSPLTFSIDGRELQFIRGRLRLEGDDIHAGHVTVSVPEDSAYIPAADTFPITDGKIFVVLIPRPIPDAQPDADGMQTEDFIAEQEADGNEIPADEYFDDDDLAEKGKASHATIWILVIACTVCVAALVWYMLYGGSGKSAVSSDTDTVKTDTVKTDTLKKDTVATQLPEETPQEYSSNYGSYNYGVYDIDAEPADESNEPKRRQLPEGTDLAKEQEH